MQTFLPYPNFKKSLACLDSRRLGKQRVEALQLINAIEGKSIGWRNHPACRMWENHIVALKVYHDFAIKEWKSRGYRNNMPYYYPKELFKKLPKFEYPVWFGDNAFHASHRSNLLRKNNKYYSQFNWNESDNLPYIWPV